MPLMFLSGKERRANGEIITGNHILRAMGNIPVYYTRPDTPLSMLIRTIDIGHEVHNILGPGTGIYGTGFPFSGGFNLLLDSCGPPPLIQEIQRYTNQQRDKAYELLGPKGSEAYHCLSEGVMPEHSMLGAGGSGTDYTEQIYNCPHCEPSLQQLCAPVPDLDICAIVDDYPSPEVLLQIDMAGQRRNLHSKYSNVPNIMQAYANLDHSLPPLAIDFVIVKRGDIVERLPYIQSGNWVNLKIPCQMIRHGTQTYRSNFLDFGKDVVLNLQAIKKDQAIHPLLEATVTGLLSTTSSDDLLTTFYNTATATNRWLYTDPVIQSTVKLRHDLIRSQGLKSIES